MDFYSDGSVQFELVSKGHGFTGRKTRVETGLAPSSATRKLWFEGLG
jgi:hypothetical protein